MADTIERLATCARQLLDAAAEIDRLTIDRDAWRLTAKAFKCASDAAPRQAEVASRQWQIATDIATRMVAGEPYTDNDVHQLAEAVAYLAAEERSDDGETPDQKLPPMCDDCGVNRADPPSKLCPGCQAYQEHQR